MNWDDPSNTHGPWRKYRCSCGYRCIGDFRAAGHEHRMTLDGDTGQLGGAGRPPYGWYEPDVPPSNATVLSVPGNKADTETR